MRVMELKTTRTGLILTDAKPDAKGLLCQDHPKGATELYREHGEIKRAAVQYDKSSDGYVRFINYSFDYFT